VSTEQSEEGEIEEDEDEDEDKCNEANEKSPGKTSPSKTPTKTPASAKSLTHIILDFGKYNGTAVQDVPFTYMIFLAGYQMVRTRRMPCTSDGYRWVKANRDQACAFAETYLKKRCWYCQGNLVPVGSSRSCGASHTDWDTRYLHKKCWKDGREGYSGGGGYRYSGGGGGRYRGRGGYRYSDRYVCIYIYLFFIRTHIDSCRHPVKCAYIYASLNMYAHVHAYTPVIT
jgi:hypothetical protein